MDTALITNVDGTTKTCTLNDTASLTVAMTSGAQTLSVTDSSGAITSVDLATVASIAFSLAPVVSDSVELPVAPSDASTDATTPDETAPVAPDAAPISETPEVAPEVVDVTNGEEIQINETDAGA